MRLKRTSLHACHRVLGGRMVDFGGWELPVSYGSQLEEHHAVRRAAGMFDVSHMTVVDLHGDAVVAFLAQLLANDVTRLKFGPGVAKALYSCMLNEQGGVIDDLIAYAVGADFFRLVVNAATRDKDLAWIERQAQPFAVSVRERDELAMIAVQGPVARELLIAQIAAAEDRQRLDRLARFAAAQVPGQGAEPWFVARTGYTGEDGFEVILPAADAECLWQALATAGVRPAGLGARDTLRLEAGLPLYGQDMDESVTPWEAGLGWTVRLDGDRDFIGRAALQAQQVAGVSRQLVGVLLEGKGVLRHGQVVATAAGAGVILSGSFSPTLERSIGLARVPAGELGELQVGIRGKSWPLRLAVPPFVRAGKSAIGV